MIPMLVPNNKMPMHNVLLYVAQAYLGKLRLKLNTGLGYLALKLFFEADTDMDTIALLVNGKLPIPSVAVGHIGN